MASTLQPNILAYKAAAAIAKGKVVKKGADDQHVAVCSAGTDKSVGILQNDVTTAEDVCEVAVPGGGAKALAGGTITQGDLLTADSNGALVATTSANDQVIAVAEEDAVANDIFSVFVQRSNV